MPPPAAVAGFDFRPVVFGGLTVEARVMGEKFKYQGWVLRATDMREPKTAGTSKSSASKPASGQNANEQKAA